MDLSTFIQTLQKQKIEAVGFDFDATALTYGTKINSGFTNYEDFKKEFIDKLSKDYVKCVHALHDAKIHQGITTFNDNWMTRITPTRFILGGDALIRPILTSKFGKLGREMEIWSLNPIDHDGYSPCGVLVPQNKNWHLHSLKNRYNIKENSRVLLVDDDINNVMEAREAGFQAFHVAGENGFSLSEIDLNFLYK